MEVNYTKASYRSRLFAFFFDFLLMAMVALGGIFLTQTIVHQTPFYKKANQKINQIQLASHLYVENKDGNAKLMCDYYVVENDDYASVNEKLDQALTEFYSDSAFFDQDDPKSGLYIYRTAKIPEGQTEGQYFVYEDETHTNIVQKSTVTDKQVYSFYENHMSKQAVSYLFRNSAYIDNSRVISLSFYFIVLLVPISLTLIIFEYIIPISIRRGKKTLGKLVFKLSVLDARGLSCPIGRFTLRFLFFFFVEVILSVVAVTIPLIVSFSMLVFSKAGQSFHDYVCGTYVVEAPMSSVYLTAQEYVEAQEKRQKFVLNKDEVAL